MRHDESFRDRELPGIPAVLKSRRVVRIDSPVVLLAGQTSGTGALTVTASDPSGTVIAGATVTVSNGATVTRKQITDANGSYTFSLLPPGNYKVSVTAPGFKTVELPSVTVAVSETGVLKQVLQVGEQTQQVQVSASAEVIQAETLTLGGVVAAAISARWITWHRPSI